MNKKLFKFNSHTFIPHPSALIPYEVVRGLPNIQAMKIEII